MNERQAETLKRLIEAGHPDAGVAVIAEPGGVEVTISGPAAYPGSSRLGDVKLSLRDDSPLLWRFLARVAGHAEDLNALDGPPVRGRLD